MTNDDEDKERREELHLWCFDLTKLSRAWQFSILTALTFIFSLTSGYMQELIFTLEGFKPFGWYLTLIQFACYTAFGTAELQLKEDKKRKIPLKMYLLLAFLTVATMGLSNTAVGYLNYPTQVIFKCCKLIPVLVGGIILQGKKFTFIEILACLCMSIGLILFNLADSSVSPNFNSYGIVLISLALCADGAIGNVQEKSLKQYGASSGEMVLYSYFIGFLYIFVGLILSGGFYPGFDFFQKHPIETYGYCLLFSFTGYMAVNVVLTLVTSFGALMAVTVTTCRKAVTIVLSFLFFTKPFTFQYLWSGLVVVFGIYLNLYSKNKTKWDAKMIQLMKRFGQRRWKKDIEPESVV